MTVARYGLNPTIYLGRIYSAQAKGGWLDIPEGALAVDANGRIEAIGAEKEICCEATTSRIKNYQPCVIMSGLIDCHQHLAHYEWTRMIPDLHKWLREIYEIELKCRDKNYIQAIAECFFKDLIRNGTTTCCIHGPYFAKATEIAFQEAKFRKLRILMGMNCGDRNMPKELCKSIIKIMREAYLLSSKWDGTNDGLLSYCYTVRPAYCSSEALLRGIALQAKRMKVRVQCHLGESKKGWKMIHGLFPDHKTEAGVYGTVGMLGPKSLFAHGVYLRDEDYTYLRKSHSALIHCPRANLLSGGAQMRLEKCINAGIPIGLGTDLGGGKGLSMFRTMEDALKVSPLLSVHNIFRMATIDGATVLGLGQKVGSLEKGKEADFIVLRPKTANRQKNMISKIEDVLSALIFRGDDRDVRATFVRGELLNLK